MQSGILKWVSLSCVYNCYWRVIARNTPKNDTIGVVSSQMRAPVRNLTYQSAMSLATSKLYKEMFDENHIWLRSLPPGESLDFFWIRDFSWEGF